MNDLSVRPPRQQRSRQAWARVLDAGVALLEEGGYRAFTIAAICERASVAPRAIYDRADSKDALLLAVYQHGVNRMRAEQVVFTDERHWAGRPARELIAEAVHQVAQRFYRYAPFLRAVIPVSGAHPQVHRQGSVYSRELGELFTAVVSRVGTAIRHPDPETAVRMCFGTVFGALVLRVSHGADFGTPPVDDDAYAAHLGDLVASYLLAPGE